VRALITGGAGFIGSHLAEALLARGDSVILRGVSVTSPLIQVTMEALRAGFRGELLAAVQAQTRTLLRGMVGAVTSLTALAYAPSRIFPVP